MKKIWRKFFLLAMIVGISACTQIDTGNVGVMKTRGQFELVEVPPGNHIHWTGDLMEISTKENAIKLEDMKPKTKDQITVADLDIDVYYQLNPTKAADTMVKLAGDIATNPEGEILPGYNYVTRTAREAVYNALSGYGSDIAHTKRTDIAADVTRLIQQELDQKFEKGWFLISNVNVRNLVVDPKLEEAIRDAAKVEYQIRQKEGEKKLAQAEADKKRIEAQGDADAIRMRAEAVKAQGGSEYVQLQWIAKWDGHQPTTQVSGNPGIVIPVGK